MYYIEGTSNPEALQIWTREKVLITWTDRNGRDHDIDCSLKQWRGLFWKIWAEQLSVNLDPISYGQYISVTEVAYDFKNNKESKVKQGFGFLIRLKVGRHTIYMCKSTWEYIKNSVLKYLQLSDKKPPGKKLKEEIVGV